MTTPAQANHETEFNNLETDKDPCRFILDLPYLSIPARIATTVPLQNVAAILNSIESIETPRNKAPLVQIQSTRLDEGADQIALETALFAAQKNGARVLLVDASGALAPALKEIHAALKLSVSSFFKKRARTSPFGLLQGTSLYFCRLYDLENSGSEFASVRVLNAFLDSCKLHFDLVLLYVGNGTDVGSSHYFSNLTDGAILVARAERTRLPVFQRLKEEAERNHIRVIGAVLNDRRRYIAPWLYKILFKA